MLTFEQEIEKLEMNCETYEEWKKACLWIGGQYVNFLRAQRALEDTFENKYGKEEFEKMTSACADEIDRIEYQNTESMYLDEYGYTAGDVRLIAKEYAETFMKAGYEVYLLGSDNTKTPAKNAEEIAAFDGLVGILGSDMDKIMENEAR